MSKAFVNAKLVNVVIEWAVAYFKLLLMCWPTDTRTKHKNLENGLLMRWECWWEVEVQTISPHIRLNASVASLWCSWPTKWKCPAIICTLLYFGQETVSPIWHSLAFCNYTSRLSLTLSCCRLLAQWKFRLRPDAHSSFNCITEQNVFPTHALSISVLATSLTSIIHNR
jgi:hypothetical protein